jgi:hypothetical protein
MAVNAYTYLPPDVCGDTDFPVFPFIQDCTSYDQEVAEICGIIFVPLLDGLIPTGNDWKTFSEWSVSIINNNETSPHYIVGVGSFLPTEKTLTTLAGGRVEENRERRYRLSFSVFNMYSGHVNWARKLQVNNREFVFFLHTIGDRVIGGPYGMMPSYSDAEIPFNLGGVKENLQITIDTDFLSFPEW